MGKLCTKWQQYKQCEYHQRSLRQRFSAAVGSNVFCNKSICNSRQLTRCHNCTEQVRTDHHLLHLSSYHKRWLPSEDHFISLNQITLFVLVFQTNNFLLEVANFEWLRISTTNKLFLFVKGMFNIYKIDIQEQYESSELSPSVVLRPCLMVGVVLLLLGKNPTSAIPG